MTEKKEYIGETIHLCELVDPDGNKPLYVDDVTFTNCNFPGPGVITFISGEVDGCDFQGRLDQVIIVPLRFSSLGVIGFRRCTFKDCSFSGHIGVLGTKELRKKFLAGVKKEGKQEEE